MTRLPPWSFPKYDFKDWNPTSSPEKMLQAELRFAFNHFEKGRWDCRPNALSIEWASFEFDEEQPARIRATPDAIKDAILRVVDFAAKDFDHVAPDALREVRKGVAAWAAAFAEIDKRIAEHLKELAERREAKP